VSAAEVVDVSVGVGVGVGVGVSVGVGDAEVEGAADVLLLALDAGAVGVVLEPTPTMLADIGATATVGREDGGGLWFEGDNGTVSSSEDGALVETGSVPPPVSPPPLPPPPIVVTILVTPTESGNVGRWYGLDARLIAVTTAAATAPSAIKRDDGTLRRQASRRCHPDATDVGCGNWSLWTMSIQTGPAWMRALTERTACDDGGGSFRPPSSTGVLPSSIPINIPARKMRRGLRGVPDRRNY
jgi:hypothetical protein